MISMRRTLLPGVLGALALGNLGLGVSQRCSADPPPPSCNSPAAYRLYNTNTPGPGAASCGRYEPIPFVNPGWFLNNPRGTGADDPWRPPHHWPQTRYPVVPAYTRPSYGFYETSWRILPLCNPAPAAAGPIYPAGYQSGPSPAFNQPVGPLPQPQSGQPAQAAPIQGPPLPRPPVVPPAVQPNQQGPPAATPPGANGQFLPRAVPPEAAPTTVPTVPLQPQKATPPTNELQPQPPKATPPATAPGLRNPAQGAVPTEPPRRAAMLELEPEEAPEIRVQPF
jgi:hypothetical protein